MNIWECDGRQPSSIENLNNEEKRKLISQKVRFFGMKDREKETNKKEERDKEIMKELMYERMNDRNKEITIKLERNMGRNK